MRRTIAPALCLALLAFFMLGCLGIDLFGDDVRPDPGEEEAMLAENAAREEALAQQQAALSAEAQAAPEGTDTIVQITLSGENLPYHTRALNETQFYLRRVGGVVTASNSNAFEESAGTDMTRRGTDSVSFDGDYDIVNERITGTLTIRTTGSATGGQGFSNNDLDYTFTGTLTLERRDEWATEWAGTVTGNSTLTQTWTGMDSPDDVTAYSVDWAATSSYHRDLTDYWAPR
jgi:hypothetical protein